MGFLIIAQPQEEYAQWLEAQRLPAPEPADELAVAGREVFLGSTCINCHAIAGTHATGNLGPDLTHLASRMTLGAATVANHRGNLGGWIADPQHTKPGVLMPATPLTGSDF
jgi:cytochrome c oxidase subunit 2